LGYGAGGEHFWPLTARQALELGFNVSKTHVSATTESTSQSLQGNLTAGHAINLLGYEKTQRFGDLRFENVFTAEYVDQRSQFVLIPVTKTVSFTSSLLYRNRWGVLRLSFTYVDLWRSY
ncbi:MAG TPA: hypothetical protein VGK45_03905, partial [Thermoanaerobaculia bacterium]